MIMKFSHTGGQEFLHYMASICTIPASQKTFSIYFLNFSSEGIWTNIRWSLIFFDVSVNCPSLLILYFLIVFYLLKKKKIINI